MPVKIRISRVGRKKQPCWRIVAVDSRNNRDGAYLDNLGTYDPLKHEIVQLHVDKIKSWTDKGAFCSDSVLKIMKQHNSAQSKK